MGLAMLFNGWAVSDISVVVGVFALLEISRWLLVDVVELCVVRWLVCIMFRCLLVELA